jgi:hypothetical protein
MILITEVRHAHCFKTTWRLTRATHTLLAFLFFFNIYENTILLLGPKKYYENTIVK